MSESKSGQISRVIIVTGGAGQIGSSICKHFDAEGNKVFMADLELKMCYRKIEDLKLKNTDPLKLDVTNLDSIRSAFEIVAKDFGRVDILINNAGISIFTPFEKRTFEEFDNVMKGKLEIFEKTQVRVKGR